MVYLVWDVDSVSLVWQHCVGSFIWWCSFSLRGPSWPVCDLWPRSALRACDTHIPSSCRCRRSASDGRPGSDAGCLWWWCSSHWTGRCSSPCASYCVWERERESNINWESMQHLRKRHTVNTVLMCTRELHTIKTTQSYYIMYYYK